ncbi:hypothetical protein BH10ACI2_BH10ACI2_21960 [soil metagenome]
MKKLARAIFLLVTGISVSVAAYAQDGSQRVSAADMYLISANAGGVNFTEGAVNVKHVSGKSGLLLKGDQVEIGDVVSTGLNGRVEILLNPGSYLRLGGNSSLEFKSTSLDDLRIKLDTGSAMFEVFATDKFKVDVATPKGLVSMVESGVYRIDLQPDGTGIIGVAEGKALVGRSPATEVKSGKMATLAPGSIKVTKFDRVKNDDLAKWSKSRAKDLAKMTASLNGGSMRNALSRSYNRGQWNLFNSFGLWVYDPFRMSYCFMPFGRNWYSPYGYGFGGGIIYYYPTITPTPRPNLPKDSKETPVPVGTGSRGFKDTSAPPFTAIDRQQQQKSYEKQSRMGDNGSLFSTPDRGYTPPDRGYTPPPSGQSFPSDNRGSSAPASAPATSAPMGSKPAKTIDH